MFIKVWEAIKRVKNALYIWTSFLNSEIFPLTMAVIKFSVLNFLILFCSTLICITRCGDKSREVILKWPAFCIKVQWKNFGNFLNMRCCYMSSVYHIIVSKKVNFLYIGGHVCNEQTIFMPIHVLLLKFLMEYLHFCFSTLFNFSQSEMNDNSIKSLSSSGFLENLHIPPWIKGTHYSTNIFGNNYLP